MAIFRSVEPHEELDRIFALPARRQLALDSAEAKALAAEVTRLLSKVANPWPGPLYPIQALALKEMYEAGGLMGLIRVGGGKTLLSALAFTVLKAQRPMLLVPSAMVKDTKRTWERLYEHWRIPHLNEVKVLAYEKLSTPASGARTLPDGTVAYPDIVTRYAPDVLVCDEAHKLGTTGAAGTRRVGRYLAAHPEVKVVALSGTMIRRSFKDAAHIAEWALHEGSPLPREWQPLEQLADCTDARTATPGARTSPGVLLNHLSPGELRAYDTADSEEDARAVVTGMIGGRILQTSGVISSSDGPLAIPARLDPVLPYAPDPAIDRELLLLLKGDETREPGTLPDGTLLVDAQALARPLVTMSLGFWLTQNPRPPEEYRQAASAWAKAVRSTIKYQPHLNLDSEYMVKDAIRRGVLPELGEVLANWDAAREGYTAATGLREPPTVATWISDETIRSVERWLKDGPGLVWVSWRALGHRLSKDLGLPYFGAGKEDASGRHVLDLKPGESAILSHASVGVGTDGLQRCHHRQLFTTAPNEQSLGRLHRPGADAPIVLSDIYLPGAQHHRRFWRGVDVARDFAGKIAGPQKLCYFENNVPRDPPGAGIRWGTLGASDDVGEDA